MSDVSGKAFDLNLLKRIMRYVSPYKKAFYWAIVLTVVLGGLTTARPILIKYTIDHFVMEPNAQGLLLFSLLMLLLLLAESAVQFVFIYLANYLGQSTIRDLRIKLYRHILRFKLKFFDTTPIGTLVTRAVSDIETIADIFAEGLLVIFGDLFKILVMVLAMFYFFDYRLVLLALSVVPVLYFATRWFQVAIKQSFQDVRTEVANLNAFVQEHLTGMNVVQIFNREKAEMEKFKVINKRHQDANIRSIWYFSIFLPVIEILSAVSIGLVTWFGGLQVVNGYSKWSVQLWLSDLFQWEVMPDERLITLGELTAIIIFINMLFRPLRQLADRFNTLQMGMVASDRVLKLLDMEDRIEDTGTKTLQKVEGSIVFENVEFGYKEDEPVLKGISFAVQPGETLAIVGATGAGKSTIINLLNRFYEINSGSIKIDGTDIRDFTLSSLRSHLAVVLQDVFLFSDSIYNNLTLQEEIDLNKVREAAQFIGVDAFIESLPGGYDYNVRERGTMLSAGQRQLLAFLRAYLINPSVLILDEATSSVDTHTELLIQKAIDKITHGRTSIVIAHRLATIKKASRILVMDKGKIVEEGTHHSLLAMGGYYSRLYEMQFSALDEES